MADNKNPSDDKPHDFEEEFDFDTNELFEANTDQLHNANNPEVPQFKSFKEKAKWPLLIATVIIVFLGWKFWGMLFSSSEESQLNEATSEENAAIRAAGHAHNTHPGGAPAVHPAHPSAHPGIPAPHPGAPAPQATAPHVPVTPPPESVPMMPAPMPMPAPAPAMAPQEEVKHLENTVNQVMDTLNKMDQKISLIGREFFAVSDNVTRLSQEVAELKARKSAPPTPSVAPAPKRHHVHPHHPHQRPIKKKIVPIAVESEDGDVIIEEVEKPTKTMQRKVDLTIHAIIPGRVWLKAPDGSTFTVTTGETIPGYGKVMVIDAPSASVVTSSGVVIR